MASTTAVQTPAAPSRLQSFLGAIGLLVFGVVCLKKRFQPEPLPPAFLPGDARGSQSSVDATKSPAPTILSAQPGTEHYIAEPNLRQEVHPLP